MAIDKITTPAVTDANITTDKVTDNAITLAKMASGTDGNIISYDASGNPVAIATGNDGQVLTSTGAGSPPAFETLPVGGTNLPSFHAYMFNNQSISSATTTTLAFNAEHWDTGSAFNTSTYTYTIPSGMGGYWTMNLKMLFSGTFTSRQAGYFNVAGSDRSGLQVHHETVDNGFMLTSTMNLTAGQAVKVTMYQDSGSTRTALGSSVFSEFSGFRLVQ